MAISLQDKTANFRPGQATRLAGTDTYRLLIHITNPQWNKRLATIVNGPVSIDNREALLNAFNHVAADLLLNMDEFTDHTIRCSKNGSYWMAFYGPEEAF